MKLDKYLTRNLKRAKAFFQTTYLLYNGRAIECVLGDNTREGEYESGGYDDMETLNLVVERSLVNGIKDGDKVFVQDNMKKRKFRVQTVSYTGDITNLGLEYIGK